ncbi:hypothetical protein DY000_02058766 [Brassica cretica]|uniref:Uncharacterized protein n=1 Tax=Brassica cretica TaxID=69181 RepID=A0ABQ7AYT6_BRACR|nr:hypothetical protein DY000_02058766 [Brassica cretica]
MLSTRAPAPPSVRLGSARRGRGRGRGHGHGHGLSKNDTKFICSKWIRTESTREKIAEKVAQRSTPRSFRDFRKTLATVSKNRSSSPLYISTLFFLHYPTAKIP